MNEVTKRDFSQVWEDWKTILGPIENIELAESCQVSPAAVSGWLNGTRTPRKPKLALASKLISELLNDGVVVIPAYNRKVDSTITTLYSPNGTVPSVEAIFETFMGSRSVAEILEEEEKGAYIRPEALSDHESVPQPWQLPGRVLLAVFTTASVLGLIAFVVGFGVGSGSGSSTAVSRQLATSESSASYTLTHENGSTIVTHESSDEREYTLTHPNGSTITMYRPVGESGLQTYTITNSDGFSMTKNIPVQAD